MERSVLRLARARAPFRVVSQKSLNLNVNRNLSSYQVSGEATRRERQGASDFSFESV